MSIRGGHRRSVAGMFCVFVGLTAARLDASPIELSTVLNGVSLTGTSNDSALAFDCLPGAVCLPITERVFSLQIDVSDEELELVLIPDLDADLAAMLKQIDEDGSMSAAEKELAKFALLKSATSESPVDKEMPSLVVKVPELTENMEKYNSSLLLKEPGPGEYLEYIGKVGYKPGYKPGGSAIIIRKPGTEEGKALVIGNETPVPEPGSLTLLGLGAAGLLLKRRRKSRASQLPLA